MTPAARRSYAGRDQDVSAFSAILTQLCDSTGALGAALVDASGECVDYASRIDPFDIKVAAAECRLVVQLMEQSRLDDWREPREIVIRANRRSYTMVMIGEGYGVVMILPRRAFEVSRRALSEAVHDLCREAGFDSPDLGRGTHERWARVDVLTAEDDERRPEAVWLERRWCDLEILGRYVGGDLHPREVGYRARLASGAEVTLVRERLGRWYADELPRPQ